MAVILGIMFACIVHFSEPLNQLTSESVWQPSDLYRFTRPPVLNRPVPLIYRLQSRSATLTHSPPQHSPLKTKAIVFPQGTTTTPATQCTNSWKIVSSPPRKPSNSPDIFSNPLRISFNPVISSSNSSHLISNSPLIVSNSNILFNLWNILLNSTILPVGYSNVLSNSSIISSDSPVVPSLNTSSFSSDVLLGASESIIVNSSNVTSNSSTPLLPSLQFCNPIASPPCVDEKFGFCINDDEYPLEDVAVASEFSKLADQFSYKLTVEEDGNLSLLVNNTDDDDLIKENTCLSITVTIKPLRARNIDGDWRVIVQDVKDIIQRQRVSICSSPDVGCSNSDHFSRVFCFNGRCYQKFAVQRFLAFDPCNPDRDVFVDSFKMQSECNCRISRSPCPVYRYDV